MNNNEVYWLIYKEQHNNYPQSDLWVNDLYIVYENVTFTDNLEMVLDTLHKNKPSNYVVVIDTTDAEEKKLVNKTFISNNIIDISNGYDREKVHKQIDWILSRFGKDKHSNGNIWFTSDTHFGHKNIIQYCDRPWNSGKDEDGKYIISDDDIKKMDEEIIKNWNSTIGKNDIVWHLGDFALGPKQNERIPELVSKLNGKINLVLGNHDHHSVDFYYKAGFHRVYDRPVIINSYCILSHAPIEFVKGPFFNIYGHVHDCETYKTWSKDSCCMCVERHNYKPISFIEIKRHYDELNRDE